MGHKSKHKDLNLGNRQVEMKGAYNDGGGGVGIMALYTCMELLKNKINQ